MSLSPGVTPDPSTQPVASTAVLTVPQAPVLAGVPLASTSFQVPLAAGSRIRLSAAILATDLVDPTKSIQVGVYRSDNLGGWIFDHGFTWQGGPGAVNPSQITDLDGLDGNGNVVGTLRGQTCQIKISAPVDIAVGLSIDVGDSVSSASVV